jgi:hypothetical protein
LKFRIADGLSREALPNSRSCSSDKLAGKGAIIAVNAGCSIEPRRQIAKLCRSPRRVKTSSIRIALLKIGLGLHGVAVGVDVVEALATGEIKHSVSPARDGAIRLGSSDAKRLVPIRAAGMPFGTVQPSAS